MANQSFKTYARGYREQAAEETFKEGQVFTRAPLDTGKSRLIVNYDLINDGESLANRKGYRTTLLSAAFEKGDLIPKITDDVAIQIGKDVIEEDDEHYRLIIANQFSDEAPKVDDKGIYAAPAEMYVVQNEVEDDTYKCLDEYNIASRNLYAIPVSYPADDTSTDKPKSLYKVPLTAKVHDLNITKKKYLSRPIGCFAYSNDYYNFNTEGKLIRAIYDAKTKTYAPAELKPKTVTATEATTFGFNMLSAKPFDFENKFGTTVMVFDGFMIYKNGNAVPYPLINTPYDVKLFYEMKSGNKYKIVWEYCEATGSEWVTIKTQDITYTQSSTVTAPGELILTGFSSPYTELTLRVSAYLYNGSTAATTAEAISTLSVSYSKANTDANANRELINYDLSKSSGMVYWKNRVWLYGLSQDPTVLFCSDINDPSYFPYPNNIDIFDEPIVSVAPFNDTLLVFTKNEIIQLTLKSEGGWTKKVLQGNLNFTDFDANFIQVVKNMVFFKSGDYYYMIVPKTLSLQNELAIAPVSKNINTFLDDFSTNVTNLLEIMFDYRGEKELIAHYNYLNYEDINNVYTFKLESGLLFNLVLLYNTVNRTWRMYTYQSESVYVPLRQDATKQCVLMAPIKCTIMEDDVSRETNGVQFIETSRTEVSDFYVLNGTVLNKATDWPPDEGVLKAAFEEAYKFKNWQVLDTGYRNDIIDLNKRYRELQIKFNNVSSALLKFTTEFILDGETRIGRYKYETEHVTDPSSPNYGLIIITRTPVENLEVPGGSALGASSVDLNAWALDSSRFPEVSYWKARLKVSGKGYTPRFRLIGRTEETYELLGYTWVYRMMYSR